MISHRANAVRWGGKFLYRRTAGSLEDLRRDQMVCEFLELSRYNPTSRLGRQKFLAISRCYEIVRVLTMIDITRPAQPGQSVIVWRPVNNNGLAKAMRAIKPDLPITTDDGARAWLNSVNEAVEFYAERNGYPIRECIADAETAMSFWRDDYSPEKNLLVSLVCIQNELDRGEDDAEDY